MTNQPPGPTPVRNLRVPGEIWDVALENARADGKTITEVITAYLKKYNAAAAGKRTQQATWVALPDSDDPPRPAEPVTLTVDNREGTFTPSEPTELPDHQARKDLFEEHLTIEDYTAYVRAEREAHAAGTPKFALPGPLLPEALSLGVYIRARADRKL